MKWHKCGECNENMLEVRQQLDNNNSTLSSDQVCELLLCHHKTGMEGKRSVRTSHRCLASHTWPFRWEIVRSSCKFRLFEESIQLPLAFVVSQRSNTTSLPLQAKQVEFAVDCDDSS